MKAIIAILSLNLLAILLISITTYLADRLGNEIWKNSGISYAKYWIHLIFVTISFILGWCIAWLITFLMHLAGE